MKMTEEKRYWNFRLRLFLAEIGLNVFWNAHNVSSRVAEFDFLMENFDSGSVKLVLTHFDFHLSAIFITLRPSCDISM